MKYLSDALLIAGAGAVCVGTGCIYWPAGITAGGLFMLGGGLAVALLRAGVKPRVG